MIRDDEHDGGWFWSPWWPGLVFIFAGVGVIKVGWWIAGLLI